MPSLPEGLALPRSILLFEGAFLQAMEDLTGRRFGRWAVLGPAAKGRRGDSRFECQCECGTRKVLFGHCLKAGNGTRSCGCLARERAREVHLTHGKKYTPEYRAWVEMVRRCVDARRRNYADYGGRGIKVCERWLCSFEAFYADVGPRPSPDHSLDRHPDNDGDYMPGNCRWATRVEQQNNKRTSRKITHDGRTMSISEWSRFTGLDKTVVRRRLDAGWSAERALTTLAKGYKLMLREATATVEVTT